jgi:hypothetical protein
MTTVRPNFFRLLLAMIALATIAAIAVAIVGAAAGPVPFLGAVTLAESAKLSQNDLQAGVIETFILEGKILDRIPLLEINGNAYQYNLEAALPGIEFRAVNAGYTESTGTFNQATENLVILGGDADVDRFIQQTRSNLVDQRETQTRMKIKAANYKYQDTVFNGDTTVDANSFDGLKKRLTGSQVLDAGVNGLPVVGTSDADRHAFFDQIDQLLAASSLGADDIGGLYMNSMILGKFKSAARRIGGWTQRIDDFGRSIDQYNGVDLLDAGKRADGTLILPQTETQGTNTVCSSIYAVRFGEDESDGAVTGLTNGGIQVDDLGQLETKPALRTRIEFYTGIAVFGKGAARLRGIQNA